MRETWVSEAHEVPTAAARERLASLVDRLSEEERAELLSLLRTRREMTAAPGDEGGFSSTEPLTRREREVLTLVANGYTRAEIACSLSISINTAASHVASIYRKRGIGSIAEATRWAIRSGVIEL